MSYTLIDPPITPYSTPEEIQEWITELESWEQNDQVKQALKEAQDLLREIL